MKPTNERGKRTALAKEFADASADLLNLPLEDHDELTDREIMLAHTYAVAALAQIEIVKLLD